MPLWIRVFLLVAMTASAVAFGVALWDGLRSDSIRFRSSRHDRKRQPVRFWTVAALYGLFALMTALVGFAVAFDPALFGS